MDPSELDDPDDQVNHIGNLSVKVILRTSVYMSCGEMLNINCNIRLCPIILQIAEVPRRISSKSARQKPRTKSEIHSKSEIKRIMLKIYIP